MPPSPLRPRLDTVLAMVPPDARAVADIGYDHGLLMLRLGRQRPALRLFGVEMLPDRAAAMRQRHPAEVSALAERLTLLVGDGLAPLPAGAVDCVVIAGLSDRTLVSILDRARATLPSLRRVVLCPARVEATLRPALPGLGLRIVDERIAAERGRTWDVIAVEPAAPGGIPTPQTPPRKCGARCSWRAKISGCAFTSTTSPASTPPPSPTNSEATDAPTAA